MSDDYAAYDDRRLAACLKQRCLSHLLSDLKEMQESKKGRALHFARQMTLLLHQALALGAEKPTLDPFSFAQRARALETQLDLLIAPRRRLTDRENAQFAKRLRKHRPHLLRFFYVDYLDATNNQAERKVVPSPRTMLRPAVITRKSNGCNRTQPGAETQAILSSLQVTCHQHFVPILDYLAQLQRYGDAPPSLVSAISVRRSLPVLPTAKR